MYMCSIRIQDVSHDSMAAKVPTVLQWTGLGRSCSRMATNSWNSTRCQGSPIRGSSSGVFHQWGGTSIAREFFFKWENRYLEMDDDWGYPYEETPKLPLKSEGSGWFTGTVEAVPRRKKSPESHWRKAEQKSIRCSQGHFESASSMGWWNRLWTLPWARWTQDLHQDSDDHGWWSQKIQIVVVIFQILSNPCAPFCSPQFRWPGSRNRVFIPLFHPLAGALYLDLEKT